VRSSIRFFFLFLFPFFFSVSGLGQASANSQTSDKTSATPTFHAQSKLVVVDVVVTDKSGKAVTGLKASDFQLSENGTPQPVRVFEEHSVVPMPPRAIPAPLPPGQYTNFPFDAPKNSVNILLFDMLNTRAEDQQWARMQMLKALQKLPPGQQVALFTLGRSLQMVQGVSGDSTALVAAASALLARPDSMTPGVRIHQDDIDRINKLAKFNGEFMGGTNNDPAEGPNPLQALLLYGLAREENAVTEQRVGLTLQALEAIGHTMSAYPGRKNLIWLTGGIPFPVLTNMNLDIGHQRPGYEYAREFAKTASVLADCQIAIYPVDVRGLPTVGLTVEDAAQGAGDGSSTIVRDAHQGQTMAIWDSRDTMKNLAHETGGRAFYGTNDVSMAIDESMVQGSHYYTLAYVPTNRKNDGLYRNIKVTTERSGVELTYRRGYFASDGAAPTGDEAAKVLAAALQPGMPPATSILMKVRVQPPDASHKTTRVDYAVESSDVQFVETPHHMKHFTLDFMAVAWDSEGRVAGSASDTLSPALKPEFNMASLTTGIPASQELTLKPGKYVLSLGLMDRNTRKVGTVWASLTVPETASK
jgi:VWFA-related protein